MFRKQVKCCNCGFLALRGAAVRPTAKTLGDVKLLHDLGFYGVKECTQRGRDQIDDGTHRDVYSLTCARHVWSGLDFKGKSMGEVYWFLTSERKCPYFFPYDAGYSPAEHRELQREAKNPLAAHQRDDLGCCNWCGCSNSWSAYCPVKHLFGISLEYSLTSVVVSRCVS